MIGCRNSRGELRWAFVLPIIFAAYHVAIDFFIAYRLTGWEPDGIFYAILILEIPVLPATFLVHHLDKSPGPSLFQFPATLVLWLLYGLIIGRRLDNRTEAISSRTITAGIFTTFAIAAASAFTAILIWH